MSSQIAYLVSGQARYTSEAQNSFKHHVMSKNKIKVFVHSWEDSLPSMLPTPSRITFIRDLYKEFILPALHSLENLVINLISVEKLIKAIVPDNAVIKTSKIKESFEKISFYETIYDFKRYNETSPSKVIGMFSSLEESFRLFEAHTIKSIKDYDLLVRSRADIIFLEPFNIDDLPILSREVWIPEGRDYRNGLNDQLAIGGPSAMRIYFESISQMKEYLERGGIMHPEVFLKTALENNHLIIKRFSLNYKLSRPKQIVPGIFWNYGLFAIAWTAFISSISSKLRSKES